jgi:hypothetical protein
LWEKGGKGQASQGFTQTYGIDYEEAFVCPGSLKSVRLQLSIAANRDWPLFQLYQVGKAFPQQQLGPSSLTVRAVAGISSASDCWRLAVRNLNVEAPISSAGIDEPRAWDLICFGGWRRLINRGISCYLIFLYQFLFHGHLIFRSDSIQ